MNKLTIIVPVYNETRTICDILDKISKIKIDKQIIVIDDCSTDGSKEKILSKKSKIDKLLFHEKNLGKGAAIRSAQKYIDGDYIIIQDADLEYDPNDYYSLLEKISKDNLKVLYGSRVLKHKSKEKIQNFSHAFRIFANQVLTFLNNIINRQKLTDAHTCYKVFDTKLFKSIKLEEKGFAFCPEITTKLSLMGFKIQEIPITYNGRTYKEGKKIKIKHGFEAINCLIKYRYFKS